MTKNILLAIIFSAFTGSFVKAQFIPVSHAQWKLSTQKISDCEYDLVFTVTLDKDWHTFSIVPVKGAENEVFATSISFNPNQNYSLVGKLKETKPSPEYDKTIEKTVFLHHKKVVFTQRVKLNSAGAIKISGRYEYQVCKEVCEKPPYEKFDFDLQGTATCKK